MTKIKDNGHTNNKKSTSFSFNCIKKRFKQRESGSKQPIYS